MKKLFELIKKVSELEPNKKLIIKVTAGVLLLVVAFAIYLGKNSHFAGESLDITNSSDLVSVEQEADPSGEENQSSSSKITIYVDVTGAVVSPSVIKLPEGSRVFQAIELVGGITANGDTKYINLAAKLMDGEQLYIPTKMEVTEKESLESQTGGSANIKNTGNTNLQATRNIGVTSNSTIQSNGLININTADSQELQELTGVGPSTSEKIISYRNDYGAFEKIEDLKNVSGIGDKTFDKFKDKICVN